jgi:ABC-2 type transport system permease protein
MNIFLREIRANFKSLLIWSGIVVLFCAVGFSKFSAFYGNPELLAILDSMPPALIAAFSMDAFNLTTVTGFFGLMVMYFGLILSIAAAMWGSDIISKEERDRTVEFSLTLPITRSRVITAKLLAAAFNCVLLLLVTWGASYVFSQSYSPDSAYYQFIGISMLALLLMQFIFLALGIFLGCVMKQHKRAGSMAVSILLATYFLSILSELSSKLDFLKYFSPFKFFDAGLMLRESRLETTFVLLDLAVALVLISVGYVAYSKRDLYI